MKNYDLVPARLPVVRVVRGRGGFRTVENVPLPGDEVPEEDTIRGAAIGPLLVEYHRNMDALYGSSEYFALEYFDDECW
jgi:hypothetical protein